MGSNHQNYGAMDTITVLTGVFLGGIMGMITPGKLGRHPIFRQKHSKIPRCPKIHQAASDALNLFREIGDRTPA